MANVVFIAGLGRSGSTLLHFIVGRHPRCIALGEVWGLIRSPEAVASACDTLCSCGMTLRHCSFWSDLMPRLRGDGDYRPVFEHVQARYGERIVVDSSKHTEALQPGARVLYSIRDVRGWAVSVNSVHLRGFLHWYRKNRHDLAALTARGPLLTVSYDELALNPWPSVERVCAFLDLDFQPEMVEDYGNGEHHAVLCNRMKGDARKMAAVRYDPRWLADRRTLLPAALLPKVMRYNERNVYGLVVDQFATPRPPSASRVAVAQTVRDGSP